MKIFPKVASALICALSLGILGSQANTIHASSSQNSYWKNRITRFAPQRHKYLHSAITWNTRDLGGYNIGKYRTRSGEVYRSANLHSMNASGARAMKRLHIHTIIDLRNRHGSNSNISQKPGPGEFGYMKDPYKLHLKYIQQHVETGKQETDTWAKRRKYGEVYRFGYWYTQSPTARKAYHNSLMDILKYSNKNQAVLFNCTQGRDRTGVLSAILLASLGANKQTIYNDFMLTNYYKYQTNWVDQVSRLNRFYATVYKDYGSMTNYLHKGIGLSNHNIQSLRHHLLILEVKPNSHKVYKRHSHKIIRYKKRKHIHKYYKKHHIIRALRVVHQI